MRIIPLLLASLALLLAMPAAAAEKRSGKVILHSIDFQIEDLFLMYTIDRPELEDATRNAWEADLETRADEVLGMEVVSMPKLSPEEELLFDDIEEFMKLVSGQIRSALNPQDKTLEYEHKRNDFDYEIGGELAFIREKSGADYMLFYYARQYLPDSTRTVHMNMMRMDDLAYSFAGLVELKTGKIAWFESAKSDIELEDPDDRAELIEGLFGSYPNSRYHVTSK